MLGVILFSSCSDEEIYQRAYLSDNGCNIKIEGALADHAILDSVHLFLYESFGQSSIMPWSFNREASYRIMIERNSADYQNSMSLILDLSEDYNLLWGQIQCEFNLLLEANTWMQVYWSNSSFDHRISNFKYDSLTHNLTFDFADIELNNDDETLYFRGSVDLDLYRKIN
jgi:hypothetical protein